MLSELVVTISRTIFIFILTKPLVAPLLMIIFPIPQFSSKKKLYS